MVAYTGIQGQNILIVSSDPANPIEGQIWYNSTSNLLKGYVNVVNAWSSGGNVNTATQGGGGAGTQTSALKFAGGNPFGIADSESYDGTSWTTTPSLNTARYDTTGCGASNTAALCIGGFQMPGFQFISATESFNGSSWTSLNSLNGARYALTSFGTQGAANACGGSVPPGFTVTNATENWNGTSWTSSGNLNTSRMHFGGSAGTQPAGLVFGGDTAGSIVSTAAVESFNGTSWTSGTSINTARGRGATSGAGTQTAALLIGGLASNPPGNAVDTVELWNGVSWAATGSLSIARQKSCGGQGTTTAALATTGYNSGPSSSPATEEFNGSLLQIKTITTS